MNTMYYMRHGVTRSNQLDRWCGGGSEVPLIPEGHEQAKKAGQIAVAQGLNFDVIISSPRQRAIQSAHHVADCIGYPHDKIVINPLFDERDFGELEGKPHDDDLM